MISIPSDEGSHVDIAIGNPAVDMPMSRLGFGLVVMLMAAVPASGAGRAADPAEGRELAERWCAACHAVAPGAASDRKAR